MKEKIKILRIIARLNIGGPARNAVLLSEGLKAQGSRFKVQGSRLKADFDTVLLCGETPSCEGDMMYIAREKGIEPVIIKELGRELSLKNDWIAFWKIFKIIRREKPDIIHTHTAKAGTLGRLAGILYKITHVPCLMSHVSVKLVHTFHGHVFSGYFGRLKSFVFIRIEKILALFTVRLITVSDKLKEELVKKYRIAPEKKIDVVELGFELDDLLRLEPRPESDCVNVGIIGRLVPIKNHKMFLKVISDMGSACRQGRQGIRDKVKFHIIGDGELRRELEGYAGKSGIGDVVEFRGWITDLVEIYQELDIVALTSLNEGTPVSLIEAMAAGRAVVATRVGGVADIVKDNETGYLIDSENCADFADKLSDLVSDYDKRNQFALSGRESVKERFLKDRLIKDTYRLYNNILQIRKNT